MGNLTHSAAVLVRSPWFQRGVIGLILLAGIVAGLETSRTIFREWGPWLERLNLAIVLAFTAEVLLRLAALGRDWRQFFKDPWNLFDVGIVALSWIPLENSFAPMLRVVRVLRVLRLIPQLPQLQMLVGALLRSIPPMSYIALLLLLLFYVYAVAGVMLFGQNDPLHFGSLGKAMLSLFQVATLENWSMFLNIQMLGSAQFGYEGKEHLTTQSSAQPLLAVAYFVSFIMLGTMIVLNLLIGVIINSMSEARAEVENARRERHCLESGRPTVGDDLSQAEQQLGQLQKQLQVIRTRLRDSGVR